MTEPIPEREVRRHAEAKARKTRELAPGKDPYPYIHPEALHSEPLAISVDDVLAFLDHYGDEGPDLKASAQAP